MNSKEQRYGTGFARRSLKALSLTAVATAATLLIGFTTDASAVSSTSTAQPPGMTGAGVASGSPASVEGPGLTPVPVALPDLTTILSSEDGDIRPLAANTRDLKTAELEPLVSTAEQRMLESAMAIESTWRRLMSLWSVTRALEGQLNVAKSKAALIQAGMFVGQLETLSDAELLTTDDPTSLLRAYTDADFLMKRAERRVAVAQDHLDSVVAERDALFGRSVDQVITFETQRMWLGQLLSLDTMIFGAPVPTSTLVALVDLLATQGLAATDRAQATDKTLAWFDVPSSIGADKLATRVRQAGLESSILRTATVSVGGVPVVVVTRRAAPSSNTLKTPTPEGTITDGQMLVPALWLRTGSVSLPSTGLPGSGALLSFNVTRNSDSADTQQLSSNTSNASIPELRQQLAPKNLRSSAPTRSTSTGSASFRSNATQSDRTTITTPHNTTHLADADTTVTLVAGGLSPLGTGRVMVNEATFEKVTIGLRITEHYAVQVDGSLTQVDGKRVKELGNTDPTSKASPTQNVGTAMWRVRAAALLLGASEARTGWVPTVSSFLPDSTARQLIGATEYRTAADRSTDWVDTSRPWHVDRFAMPILGSTTCSSLVARQLSGALAVLGTLGLDQLVDPSRFGGCYAPRMIRDSWALSMHARGLALDFNVGSNLMGATGDMDPRVVTVMEAFGFRWGGYWNNIDPMHFEAAMLADPDNIDVDYRSLWGSPSSL